jgi:deazaflavin-dependent oxidoreductase (nitroreductase family)
MSWWDRRAEAFARTKAGGWFAINVANPIDRRLLRWTRGRVGLFVGQPVGLLETVGARSGQPRTTPLLYAEQDRRIVLIASKAGAERHPAWYHNLTAHPDVEVEVDGGLISVSAHEAEGAEREELWRLVNDNYSGYDVYQRRAGARRIPVMVLTPR